MLCDENIPKAVNASLVEWGFNVSVVDQGAADSEIAKRARREKRILITFDSDFANILVYPPQILFGIIRINIHPQFKDTVIFSLQNVFRSFQTQKSLRGKLIIAEAVNFRVWEG